MTYHWQPEDIIAGRWVCRHPRYWRQKDFTPELCGTWVYKIGFVNGGGKDNLALISMMDGMVSGPKTAEQLATRLTKDDMMPMPTKWQVALVEYLRDSYQDI